MNSFQYPVLIEPVGHLDHQSAVFDSVISRKGVFSIDDEQVRYRGEPPLEPKIKIKIINLVVILDKACEEEIIGKGKVKSRTN